MLDEHRKIIEGYWEQNVPGMSAMLLEWSMSPEEVLAPALQNYQEMLEDCAYTDAPGGAFGRSFFTCLVFLALYQTVRDAVDVHQLGAAMLEQMRSNMREFDARANGPVTMDVASPGTHPGEFQVEVVEVNDSELSWGLNITSCAICYQFSKFDAMDLVPYMCASDDVVSDKGGQGLRRTGTIALGAHQCDFRYDPDSTPLRVAEAYPDRIKFVH